MQVRTTKHFNYDKILGIKYYKIKKSHVHYFSLKNTSKYNNNNKKQTINLEKQDVRNIYLPTICEYMDNQYALGQAKFLNIMIIQ